MASKKFWFGMLAMALIFGMTVVGCEDDSLENKLPDDPIFTLFSTSYADSNPSGIRVLINGDNATQYAIYYSETSTRNGGQYENVRAEGGWSAVYWFTNLTPNRTYYFWVRAMNSNGHSNYVGPKSASFSRN
jgi:hypothetical protein